MPPDPPVTSAGLALSSFRSFMKEIISNLRYWLAFSRADEMAQPSHTESDLRQTAIDEYFASCHKAAVIGGEEQGHSSGFVRVAYAF